MVKLDDQEDADEFHHVELFNGWIQVEGTYIPRKR